MVRKKQVNVRNSQVVKREEYTGVLKRIVAEGHCPFCEKYLLLHHREPVLFKTEHWLITTNAWPYEGTRIHFLIIARKHIEASEEASPRVWRDLSRVCKRLTKEYKLKGSTFFMRSGDMRMTGASVRHLHAQIVTGTANNKTGAPITALVGFKKEKTRRS